MITLVANDSKNHNGEITFAKNRDSLEIKIPTASNANIKSDMGDTIIISSEALKKVDAITSSNQSTIYTPDGKPHTRITTIDDSIIKEINYIPVITIDSYKKSRR